VLDEDPPDDILIDRDTEGTRYLLGNLPAAEAGFRRFISMTASISSFDGPLGPWRRRFLGL
jgi:hypothetical protein